MTSTLQELEQRLEREPDNLPLRVTVAGTLRAANRADAAVEHYRKVAIAYRSQGRAQQALAVCKSILELAPDDIAIHALVKDLEARVPRAEPVPDDHDEDGVDVEFSEPGDEPPAERIEHAIRHDPSLVPRDPVLDALVPHLDADTESDDATSPIEISQPIVKVKMVVPSPAGTRSAPARKSSTFETETPLPNPIPYHIADPTSAKAKIPVDDLDDLETRPGASQRAESDSGLAQAARRISGMISNPSAPDLAHELETRQQVRISAEDLGRISHPPPTVPTEQIDLDLDDDAPTPIPDWAGNVTRPGGAQPSGSDEDDLTVPLEKLAIEPIGNAFFVSLPAPQREAALARCLPRTVTAGTTVIRLGETSHALILVVSGQLDVRHDRVNDDFISLDTIEPGQFIGEAALLARSPAPASIIAITDCELLALPPHAVFELAGAYPALWAALKDSAERRTRQHEKLVR